MQQLLQLRDVDNRRASFEALEETLGTAGKVIPAAKFTRARKGRKEGGFSTTEFLVSAHFEYQIVQYAIAVLQKLCRGRKNPQHSLCFACGLGIRSLLESVSVEVRGLSLIHI